MISFFKELSFIEQTAMASIFTWGMTALGAAFVFFFKSINKTVMDATLGFAAGVMIAASFWSLLAPARQMAEQIGINPTFVLISGFIFGGAMLFFGDKIFEKYAEKGEKRGNISKSKRIIMLVVSITLHNIPEGLAIGVAFGSLFYNLDGATLSSACALALGIGLQNLPEGTAVSVPLLREGYSRKKAFFIGQLSAVVEPIAAVLGALSVIKMRMLLPFFLSFAAGAMIYVVVEELIPESQSNEKKNVMALFTIFGFSVMMALDTLF